MEGGSASKGKNNIPSVEDVFMDIKRRRNALRTALTTDADAFYCLCDPKKNGKSSVCLVGFGDEKWSVKPKLENEELLVAADLRPEPSFGINFIRDSMQKDQWLCLVAADHSDSWLLALASFTASQNQFSASERRRLCIMITELSTLSDEIRSWKAKREREQQIPTASSSQKSPIPRKPRTLKARRGRKMKDDEAKSHTWISSQGYQGKASSEESRAIILEEAEKEEGNNYEEKVCRACKHKEETWIRCCNCDNWFHEKCANNVVSSSSSSSSAAAAASEDNFRCPICRTPPKLRKYPSL